MWVESSSVCAEEVRRDVQLWVSAESVKQNADMNPLHHVNLMVLEFLLKLINYDCRKAQSEFDPPRNTVWKAWQWYQTHCQYSKSIIQICVQTHKLSFFLYFHLVWTCFNILVHWFPMFQIKYKWIRVQCSTVIHVIHLYYIKGKNVPHIIMFRLQSAYNGI